MEEYRRAAARVAARGRRRSRGSQVEYGTTGQAPAPTSSSPCRRAGTDSDRVRIEIRANQGKVRTKIKAERQKSELGKSRIETTVEEVQEDGIATEVHCAVSHR